MLGLTEHNPSAVEKAHELYRLGWTREALSKWVDPVDGTTHTLEEAYARQTLRGYGTVVGVSHCTTPNIQFIAKGSPLSAHFVAGGTQRREAQDPVDALKGAHAAFAKPTPRHFIPVRTERGDIAYWVSKRSPEEILRQARRLPWWRRAWVWATNWLRRERKVVFDIETAAMDGSPSVDAYAPDDPREYLQARGWVLRKRMEWHFHDGKWSRVSRPRWYAPDDLGGVGWPMATAIDMQRRRDLECEHCGGSGIVRSLGRDNDEIIEDCPHCRRKP